MKNIFTKNIIQYDTKNILLKEMRKELDLKGKIVLYIFPKSCIKIYAIASKNTSNNMLT